VIPLYVASLVVGFGVLAVQLVVGHDTGGGGHDLHHDDGAHDLTPWTMLASVRFWSFALLAFGLVGTLLTALGVATGVVALSIAGVAGVASGALAATVVSRLLHRSPESNASFGDVLGRMGRVVVPITSQGPGKIRVEVKGTSVDLIARAREAIDMGEPVVVEEVTSDGEAQVSRAPKELAP
jgi:membrane protein implicated in regulation of membrane protease activity